MPDRFVLLGRYHKRHGEWPNVTSPQTFNEKVLYRILFDRRPVLTRLADKAAVRSYVEARLGRQILPRLYHLTTRPETLPFDELPQKFVLKPTHGSGWVKIVTDKSLLDRTATIKICTKWLNQSYYEKTREWHYKHIEPRIIVEEFIDEGTGAAPNDYKLFVFAGSVEVIQVDAGRFTDHRRRLYSPAWKKLDVRFEYDDITTDVPAPSHLKEMIASAEVLGKDLDFIRADFYDTADGLYFGELTAAPEAALGRFAPKEYDHYLGRRWK
jgi:hypothetical protein